MSIETLHDQGPSVVPEQEEPIEVVYPTRRGRPVELRAVPADTTTGLERRAELEHFAQKGAEAEAEAHQRNHQRSIIARKALGAGSVYPALPIQSGQTFYPQPLDHSRR